jgi:hypothetical protein
MARGLLLMMAALWASAQTGPPAVLENSGKPMAVPFLCTEEDIRWAGLSCSDEEPCPVYLELNATESIGNRIFATGNLHSAAVTLYSVLLGSADAGHTWREAHTRIRGAGLDHIQFIDPSTGWTSGESLFPLSQDPFLLLTSDGGETWRQQPVFNESRYGSIQQFYFSSKTNGSLILDRGQGSEGDRYALYESPDGGETWAVREESGKPMQLKRAAEPSEWRIRADGPTRSFHIEHRADGHWTSVAAFAVSSGACKSPQASEK